MRWYPIAIATALSFTTPVRASVSATDAPEKAQPPQAAVDAFMQGRERYREGRWVEALAAFLEADRLNPAPDLQYNIGLCHMRLENWTDAITAFEIYLRTAENPADREDVEGRIRNAKILRDAQQQAARRERLKDDQPAEPVADEPASTDESPDERPDAAARPHAGRGLIVSGAVLSALGAATAIVGGAVFGTSLERTNEELEDVYDNGNSDNTTFAEAEETLRDAERFESSQWITIGAGAGIAAVGVVLLSVGLVRRSRDRRELSVVPLLRRSSAGVTVGGRF